MNVSISNTYDVEKPSFFGRKILTYTLALGITFSDFELASIEQKNLYARVVYEPPWHPHWQVPEDEDPPGLLVHNLVEIHNAKMLAAVGYFADDHEANVQEGKLRKALEELKVVITTLRPSFDEFEL